MKKTLIFAATAAIAGVMITGCGSSKPVAQAKGATVVQSNICEQMQEEKPATRAVGKGTHFKEQTAKNIAETQARAQFARALSSKIKTATSEETLGYDLYSGDAASGSAVTDQGAKQNDLVQSIANEAVSNTIVIKTYKELLPNNQYNVWVCLEYQAGVAEIASSVAKKVQQRIPDEQKMKMNFEFDQYRKRVEAELEKSQQGE
ncbi:hypothetical protein AGMMS49965_13700 [Bacteroidia bacterium]|nr:hypothetical protein AGMMS49965_13700 [Bacteroidia bacterium]